MDSDLQVVKHQTIALCMIVKDEEEIILRALNSVSEIVDYYCICDTGSSDNTVKVIEDYLKENNLSGAVHQRPWVNFAHNRSESFDLAKGKCDYRMTMDADEVLAYYDGDIAHTNKKIVALPKFTADRCYLDTYTPHMVWWRPQFFKDDLDWKWTSPVHEVCQAEDAKTYEKVSSLCIIPHRDGARAKDSNRFLYDAFIFEKAVIDSPEDWRYWFYVGQSYHDAGRLDQALVAYKKCAENTHWSEEKSVAYLRIARILSGKEGFDAALPYYWKSYNANPNKGESIFDMLRYYRAKELFHIGARLGDIFLTCNPEGNILFTEHQLYKWRAKDELSICYFYTGKHQESIDLIDSIIDCPMIPEDQLDRIKNNRRHAEKVLEKHGVR